MTLDEERNLVVHELETMRDCNTDYQDDKQRVKRAVAFIDYLIGLLEVNKRDDA